MLPPVFVFLALVCFFAVVVAVFLPVEHFSVLFSPFRRSGVITLNLRGGSKVTEASRDVFASRTALFLKDSCKHFVHSGDQTTITLCDWEEGGGGRSKIKVKAFNSPPETPRCTRTDSAGEWPRYG